jgi:predicted Rdx family selenoprotein
MESSFWTSKDKEYLRKKLKRVLQQTMHDVLMDLKKGSKDHEKQGAITALIKKHAVEYILKEFVKTLYLYKIVNGNFEFNISVVPYPDTSASFDNEFSSNQLIIVPVDGSLSSYLKQDELGLPEKIAQVKFPQSDNPYFVGGNLSLRIKLLDFDFNPLKPIPNTKKNAIKGEIVIRKYYKMNLPTEQLRTAQLQMKLDTKKGRDTYFTVDNIYKFNLKKLSPQFHQTILYPGVLQSRRHMKTGLLSHLTYLRFKHEKSLRGRKWLFRGEYLQQNLNSNFLATVRHISFTPRKGLELDINVVSDQILSSEEEISTTPTEFKQSLTEIIGFLNISQYLQNFSSEEIK